MTLDSGFDYISVSDVSGKTYRNTDISDREYFKKAMDGITYVSSPMVSKADGKLTVLFGTKIDNGTGYSGIVYAGITYDKFPESKSGMRATLSSQTRTVQLLLIRIPKRSCRQ